MPTHHLTRVSDGPAKKREEETVCLFAQTNFRNQMRRFGIKLDDRRRHVYVVGKTGMGKTTLIENMILHDIYSGHGVGLVDPHGDSAEKIIDYIPSHRINDVIYVNPADVEYPIGFNILEVHNPEQKHLVAAGLMGIFKKIWPDVWSSRMEYILNNTLLALLDYPGSTLLGINRMLGDKKFRKKVVRALTDPVIKSFWQNEFENYEPRYQKEAVAPIQNKIGQFLSANVIRNMVAQVKSTIEIREAMDTNKIIIMNLSKGRIGEDNSRLLGGMLITKIQLAAMERVDTPEEERQDFFLFVDEFQNFATPSFANILSEARKYRLSLIMAHQYVAQLDEIVADAVFGNVGTLITFRVGGADAEFLVKEFTPTFLEEDIVNLAKYEVFLKLMINGVASQPFSATTLPPIGSATGSSEKIIRVSRERYAKKRELIEDKILRWSGMEGLLEDGEYEDEDDEENNKSKGNRQKNQSEKVSFGTKDRLQKTEDIKPKTTPHNIPRETFPEELVNKKEDREVEKKWIKNLVAETENLVAETEKNESNKEEVISLNDLLPKNVEVKTNSGPLIKNESVRSNYNQTNTQNLENNKKRKRKRKRKKSVKTPVENVVTELNKQPQEEYKKELHENNLLSTVKPSVSVVHKKIDPDTVITFDD